MCVLTLLFLFVFKAKDLGNCILKFKIIVEIGMETAKLKGIVCRYNHHSHDDDDGEGKV